MGTSTFRRSTKAEKKAGSGKGQRGNWRESFRLPKAAATPICLIAGDYVDPDPSPDLVEIDVQTGQPLPVKLKYFKWLRHRVKAINKSSGGARFLDEPCARGWDKHNPQLCAGCFAMESGDKRVTLNTAFSIGLVHLALYHRHPVWDFKNNTWVTFKDNTLVMQDTECYGKTCNFCRYLSGQPLTLRPGDSWPQYDPQTMSLVFGSRRYLELGTGHLGDLGEWDKQVSSQCGGIAYVRNPDGSLMLNQAGQHIVKGRCGAFLSVDGYACPSCNNMIINAEADPRPLPELDELVQKKYPCHHCGRPVFLREVNSCDACGNATVNNVFDGVIFGQRQGEDTQSHMVMVGFQTIEDYESTLPQEIRNLYAGKSLRNRIEELSKPYNFEDLYKAKAPDAMAKRLEIALPPGFGGAPVYPTQPGQVQQPQYGQAPQYPTAAPQPQYAQAPAFTPYATPTGPGPAPFVPPAKPNFGN